jgi:hypothetical protein
MRKLCTNEVGGVKMKKNEKKKKKKKNCIEKMYFFYCSFMAASLALHFKDDL